MVCHVLYVEIKKLFSKNVNTVQTFSLMVQVSPNISNNINVGY